MDATTAAPDGRFARYALGAGLGLCVTLGLFLLMHEVARVEPAAYPESAKGERLRPVRLEDSPFAPRYLIGGCLGPPYMHVSPKTWTPGWKIARNPSCSGLPCAVSLTPPPAERPGPPVMDRFLPPGEQGPIGKIAPIYPRYAVSRGIEGRVLLEFTVTAAGGVRDLVVLHAEPPGVFDRAALAATRDLRYRPRVLNGRAADVGGQRRIVRFELGRGGR